MKINKVILNYHELWKEEQAILAFYNGTNNEIKMGVIYVTPHSNRGPRDLKLDFKYLGYGKVEVTGKFDYINLQGIAQYDKKDGLTIGRTHRGHIVLINLKNKEFYLYDKRIDRILYYNSIKNFILNVPNNVEYIKLDTLGTEIPSNINKNYARYLISYIYNNFDAMASKYGFSCYKKNDGCYIFIGSLNNNEIYKVDKEYKKYIAELSSKDMLFRLVKDGRLPSTSDYYLFESKLGGDFLYTPTMTVYMVEHNGMNYDYHYEHKPYIWKNTTIKRSLRKIIFNKVKYKIKNSQYENFYKKSIDEKKQLISSIDKITVNDSLRVGNCKFGTEAWLKSHNITATEIAGTELVKLLKEEDLNNIDFLRVIASKLYNNNKGGTK